MTPDDPVGIPGDDPDYVVVDDGFSIVNEFAGVTIRKVQTRNGQRLEIQAPLKELVVRLDAVVLEAMTHQTPEDFSVLLGVELDEGSPSENARADGD